MALPLFICDKVSASGYRLAGIETCSPDTGQIRKVLEDASADRPLIIITAELAMELPPSDLQRWLASADPPFIVVPDIRGRSAVPDLASELRRELGVL